MDCSVLLLTVGQIQFLFYFLFFHNLNKFLVDLIAWIEKFLIEVYILAQGSSLFLA